VSWQLSYHLLSHDMNIPVEIRENIVENFRKNIGVALSIYIDLNEFANSQPNAEETNNSAKAGELLWFLEETRKEYLNLAELGLKLEEVQKDSGS